MLRSNITYGQSPYKATLTREQFLFHEMRTTAKLLSDGFSKEDTIREIMENNLFQYPTEKMIKRMAVLCVNRLETLNDIFLIDAIANQSVNVSKQVCLYSIIKYSRLVRDFMVTVIAEKYRLQDLTFNKSDVNIFFLRLQEQDDVVATWSDSTIAKLKQVLINILVETEYLDTTKSDKLNPILISSALENSMRNNNDKILLPVFNCFV